MITGLHDPHRERALILMDQRRYAMAANELRAHLASEPDDPYARSLLARCLANQRMLKEAMDEVRAAISSSPTYGFAHGIMAEILSRQGKLKEAENAALEAVRLQPENGSYFAVLGQIRLRLANAKGALDAAETGLASEPDNTACANVRAMALTKLGRRKEAAQTGREALGKAPMDANVHANQGWVLLEAGQHKEALKHFEEALRIDPELAWARDGMLHALRARYAAYRKIILSWSFLMSRFPRPARVGLAIGLYFAIILLSSFTDAHPALSAFGGCLLLVYMAFVYLTWASDPLFNTLLRFNAYGRRLLTVAQIKGSNWYAAWTIIAMGCFAYGAFRNNDAVLGCSFFALLISLIGGVFGK